MVSDFVKEAIIEVFEGRSEDKINEIFDLLCRFGRDRLVEVILEQQNKPDFFENFVDLIRIDYSKLGKFGTRTIRDSVMYFTVKLQSQLNDNHKNKLKMILEMLS